MKEFLFLYPIQQYLNDCIGREVIRKQSGWDLCPKFNDRVEVNYRQRGFEVGWVLFSSGSNKQLPDLSDVAKKITIMPHDRILVSGVSFLTHTTLHVYPDPAYILAQLPRGLEQLVIGGFHQWDCVDSLGQAAYEQGIPVIVDEETTDKFFMRSKPLFTMPYLKDKAALEAYLLGRERTLRFNKPWFIQV